MLRIMVFNRRNRQAKPQPFSAVGLMLLRLLGVRDKCGVRCLIQEALIQPLSRLTRPFLRGLQDRPVLIESEVHISVYVARLRPSLLD